MNYTHSNLVSVGRLRLAVRSVAAVEDVGLISYVDDAAATSLVAADFVIPDHLSAGNGAQLSKRDRMTSVAQ